MKRFSNRTLILMLLALVAFVHFWWRMRQRQVAPEPREAPTIQLMPPTR